MNTPDNSHYTHLEYQPIDFTLNCNFSFDFGSFVKYIARYKHKNGIDDLNKALFYIDRIRKNWTDYKPTNYISGYYFSNFIPQFENEIVQDILLSFEQLCKIKSLDADLYEIMEMLVNSIKNNIEILKKDFENP